MDNYIKLKKVSSWLKVYRNYNVSERNRLYDYASTENGGKRLDYFRYNGNTYAINQFWERFNEWDYNPYADLNNYPEFIVGWQGDEFIHPLLLEIDETGEKVRLWKEEA